TLFEICHSLASQPVYRLRKTWEGLPKNVLQRYKYLEVVSSFEGNRRNYRNELKSVQESQPRGRPRACLPYIGVHLTDLGMLLSILLRLSCEHCTCMTIN